MTNKMIETDKSLNFLIIFISPINLFNYLNYIANKDLYHYLLYFSSVNKDLKKQQSLRKQPSKTFSLIPFAIRVRTDIRSGLHRPGRLLPFILIHAVCFRHNSGRGKV